MINYFLKIDSNIESILKANSIVFGYMNIGGTPGVVINQSSIHNLKKILNEIYRKDIDLNNVRDTSYQGLKLVFVSDFGSEPGVYNTDEESFEDVEAEIDDLTEDVDSIDSEIDDLARERELIVDRINMLRNERKSVDKTECINVGTKKETRPIPILDSEELLSGYKYDDTIIL